MPDLPDRAVNPAGLRLVLHGPAHLVTRAGERIELERKLAWLLAYLWIEGPTARSKLAGLLWPDVNQERARATLRQRLSILRKAAGDELVIDAGGALALAPGVAPDGAQDPSASLLAGFDYDDNDACAGWLEAQRDTRLARQRAKLLERARQAMLGAKLDEALRLADELLGLDRESEEAYRTQMEVLYLRGDAAAALAVWDRCKLMLRRLYGVAPSASTRQLGETILGAAAGAPGATSTPRDAVPVTVLRPPRLIGRAPLLRRMLDGWREGRALRVAGEAGLGKSRLLAEFAAAVGPCTIASARPGDADTPYATLGRLLFAAIDRFEPPLDGDDAVLAARLLPRLAALVPAAVPAQGPAALQTEYERRRCLLAVGRLFGDMVTRGCCALVLDDVHFADPASIEAVVEMAERGVSTPTGLRWAFAARDEELDPRNAALLSSLGESALCLRLEPLDEAGVGALIESLELPGALARPRALAPRLWQHVGGNPAFVLETIKLLFSLGDAQAALPLPPDILAAVERRIALLSAPARHLAQLAAIAGDSYDVTLAAAALACEPLALSEPLRELERSQVLYGRRFVHDVIAVAVERTIARSVAEFMHRFVAGYLEQHGGEATPIARHWSACGEHRRAGLAYLAAATRAASASRPVEQCELLDAAAASFERGGATLELFDTLATRYNVSAAPDRAAANPARLERLAALAHTEAQRLRVLLCRQGSDSEHERTGAIDVGLDAIRRAVAIGEPAIAGEFARSVAWRQALAGDEAAALATLEARRSWVMAHGGVVERAEFHGAHAAVLAYCDRLGAAVQVARQATVELRAAGNWLPMLPLLANQGVMLTWRGELEAAKDVLLEAAALRDRMHGRGSAVLIDLNLGAALRDLGDYRAAEAVLAEAVGELRRGLQAGRDLATDVAMGEQMLSQLWLSLGQPARALEALASGSEGLTPRWRARRLMLEMRAQRLQHGSADAATVEALQSLACTVSPPFYRALAELEVATTWPAVQALPLYLRLLAEPMTHERPGLLLHVAARAAQAEQALGRLEDALRHLQQACALEQRHVPHDIDRSEVWLIAHDVRRAAGDEAAAMRTLATGSAWLADAAANRLAPAWRRAFEADHPANARLLRLSRAAALPPAAPAAAASSAHEPRKPR